MSDINESLAKHFSGESNSTEEQLVQNFKAENAEEYKALKALWAQKKVKLFETNNEKAWDNIVAHKPLTTKSKNNPLPKWIPLLALALLLFSLAYFATRNQQTATGQQLIIAEADKKTINLEDGSIVYLNKNSSLSFPKIFHENTRELVLNGEAFFEVAKDANRPFIVHTNHSDVTVLGTTFNIDTKDKTTMVSVASGKVQVEANNNNDSTILTANQSVVVNDQNLSIVDIDPNYLSWKSGKFTFNGTPVAQAIKKINTYFKNEVILNNQHSDCLLNSTFDQMSLEDIMEIIQLSCTLTLTKINGTYELK